MSGQEEAVDDCDMMEEEADGGVLGSCFPEMRLNNVKKIQGLQMEYGDTFRDELLRLLSSYRCPRYLFPPSRRNNLSLGVLSRM